MAIERSHLVFVSVLALGAAAAGWAAGRSGSGPVAAPKHADLDAGGARVAGLAQADDYPDRIAGPDLGTVPSELGNEEAADPDPADDDWDELTQGERIAVAEESFRDWISIAERSSGEEKLHALEQAHNWLSPLRTDLYSTDRERYGKLEQEYDKVEGTLGPDRGDGPRQSPDGTSMPPP